MRQISTVILASFLAASTTGCLGTVVESPTRPTQSYHTTRVHLVAAPTAIDASHCEKGISHVFNYVPLWGLAVGILTFGIIVPMSTTYSCVAAR